MTEGTCRFCGQEVKVDAPALVFEHAPPVCERFERAHEEARPWMLLERFLDWVRDNECGAAARRGRGTSRRSMPS